LLHLSQPIADRPIYQFLRQQPVRSIVEVGIGSGERALRMIELASLHGPANQLRYIGIDLFEARPASDGPGLALKEAHRLLKATGVKLQLLPGDVGTTLSRTANGLTGTDLVVISAGQDPQSLDQAWFYLPRMLNDQSQVFLQETSSGKTTVRPLSAAEVGTLAHATLRRRAA
jgi:hypothetical protein